MYAIRSYYAVAEGMELVNILRDDIEKVSSVESVFCVPFTALSQVSLMLRNSSIGIGTQNVHWEEQGAFTGEISPLMVKEFAEYAIIGHSERRTFS